MKNFLRKNIETIIELIFIIIIGTCVLMPLFCATESSEDKILQVFEESCYEKLEEASDYLYSSGNYTEEYKKYLEVSATHKFVNKINENQELNSLISFPQTYVENMIKEFFSKYEEENNVTIQKPILTQIMDELENEFSKDHIIDRTENSMWLETIGDK